MEELTSRQVALLRWIGDGCPEGVMEGEAHRISAAALRTRGLVRTAGRGASWRATLTEAGRERLARLKGEMSPDAGAGNSRPASKMDPVPVPRRISRYHVAARTFRDRIERHEVSRAALERATLIVQAIATEAERRGWSVRPATESENSYGMLDWTGPKDGHLVITPDGNPMRLRIQEEGVHPRGLWEEQVARFADIPPDSPLRDEAPMPEGDYDAHGTGRLKLELYWGEWWTRLQTRWSDTAAVRLEERLPEVFAEMQARAADVAAGAERGPEAESERQRRWHDYMDRARAQVLDDHFGSALREQARLWEEAERLRRYVAALDAAFGADPAAAEWVAWARGYIERIDPLIGDEAPSRPAEPEITPELLAPHLPDGFHTSGPEADRPGATEL